MRSEQETKSGKRNGALDFLKILGTLSILLMHYQQVLEVTFPTGVNFYNGNFNWGNVVEFFFVVSGFVMFPKTAAIRKGEDGGFCDFIGKRLLRFAPMMALTALCYELVSLLLIKVYGDFSPWCCISLWGIVQNTLCIQSGWGMIEMPLNTPTWYISVLMFCYVLLYFTTKLCGKYKKDPLPVYVAWIILGVGINTCRLDLPFLNSEMGRGYSAFFTGMILAELFERYEMHGTVQIVFSLLIFVLTACGLVFDTASMTFLLYPALLIVFTTKRADKLFSAKLWNGLGRIQFHAYVWHAVILQGLRLLGWAGCAPDYNNRLTMFAFVIFTELWAAFSCRVLERPAEKLFRKLLPKKKTVLEDIQ